MNDEGKRHLHHYGWVLFLIIVANLLFINYWILTHKHTLTLSQLRTAVSSPQSANPQQFQLDEEKLKSLCGEECVQEIYSELKIATQSSGLLTSDVCRTDCIEEIYRIIKQATASSSQQAVGFAPTQVPTQAIVREIFIPFGAGFSSAGDWTDVPGLETTINTADYPGTKQVTFEATVRIPTGNQTAYVRLYNTTDGHPVWYSDVSLEGGTAKLLTSPAITLDSGNKTYRVQAKTSLQYQVNIDQARLRLKF